MYRVLGSLPWDQISTWPELELAIAALDSEQARGEAFEEFCHAFFKLQSQLYQIKDVWRFRNISPAVLEHLGTNTKQDKGIDGVLLHEDETITAYQAKFRIDRSSTPSQREVSTFYMVSDRADYRLIISNVDDLPVVVKERKDHGQILVDKLLELDGAFFSQLADLVRGTAASDRPTLAPRPYQAEALSSIVTGLNASGRGQAILACGAGKTLIGKWVCDSLECDNALVMVPSLALIRQTIGEWHHANTKPFRYLCVCSDSTVDAPSDDSWVRGLQELMEKQKRNWQEKNSQDALDQEAAITEDQLRTNFIVQTDDEWFQYFSWCKASMDSGANIHSKSPDNMKKDIAAWLRTQWALYRDKKLPEHRRQNFEGLLFSKSQQHTFRRCPIEFGEIVRRWCQTAKNV